MYHTNILSVPGRFIWRLCRLHIILPRTCCTNKIKLSRQSVNKFGLHCNRAHILIARFTTIYTFRWRNMVSRFDPSILSENKKTNNKRNKYNTFTNLCSLSMRQSICFFCMISSSSLCRNSFSQSLYQRRSQSQINGLSEERGAE